MPIVLYLGGNIKEYELRSGEIIERAKRQSKCTGSFFEGCSKSNKWRGRNKSSKVHLSVWITLIKEFRFEYSIIF